jgi:hypothetical protein
MRTIKHDSSGDMENQRQDGNDDQRRQVERTRLMRVDPRKKGLRFSLFDRRRGW